MKKKILILLYITLSISLFAIKFNIQTKNESIISFATRFELGAQLEGVADLFGTSDYKTFYFTTSFEIFKFAIGFDLKFRFKTFPGRMEFYIYDWTSRRGGLDTVFLYLDKIDFIRYGTLDDFIYFTTGEIPFINFGAGLITENYHNRFFVPILRENGLFFRFNGENFDTIGLKRFPLSFTFFVTDLLDPDTFGFDLQFSPLKLTRFTNRFDFDIMFSGAFDLNANENNRLSTTDYPLIDKGNYRNMQYVGVTTSMSLFSNTLKFIWRTDYTKLTVFNEIGFLASFENNDNIDNRFGIGNKAGAEIRAVKVNPEWDPLLGISASFVVNSDNFSVGYFSSNYEVKRQEQYYNLSSQTILAFDLGLSVYALNDDFRFNVSVLLPVNMGDFYMKLRASIFLDKLSIPTSAKIPELYLFMLFENGLNNYLDYFEENGVTMKYGNSNAGYTMDLLIRNFRFYTELGFKFYAAKIGFIFGYAYPASLKYTYTDSNRTINMEILNSDLQKFIGLSASFSL